MIKRKKSKVKNSPGNKKDHFSWKKVLLLLLAWRVFLFLLQLFSFRSWGDRQSAVYIAFETLGLWDGYWHRQIAGFGYYAPGLTLRFPLYPWIIKQLAPLFGGDFLTSGLFVSFAALVSAVIIFYKLAKGDLADHNLALSSVIALLVFPTAFFLVAVYGESLFLFLTLSSFLFFRKDNLLFAGICGGLATLVRPQGILLLPGFLVEKALKRKHWEVKNLALLLIPLALLPWCWFLWLRFGDPLIFLKDLSKWGEGPWQRARVLTSPLWVFTSYLYDLPRVVNSLKPGFNLQMLVELKEFSDFLFFIFFVILGFFVAKFFRLSYSIYYWLSLLLMLSVGTLKGVPRFGLVLFPAFLVLAKILKGKWFLLYLAISTTGFVIFFLLFSLRYWIA